MSKLLKSEFQYHKLSSIIVFGLILLVNIFLTLSNSWVKILPVGKSNITIWGLFTIYYIIFTASRLQLAKINKKRRLRTQKILPQSNYQISCVRILFILLPWIILLLILSIFYTLNTHKFFDDEWLKITGFMSIVYLLYFDILILSNDLRESTFSVKMKNFSIILELTFYFVIIFLNYLFVSKINFDLSNWSVLIKQIIHSYFLTEKGIEVNLILGIVLSISTIFTFNKRKSFI